MSAERSDRGKIELSQPSAWSTKRLINGVDTEPINEGSSADQPKDVLGEPSAVQMASAKFQERCGGSIVADKHT